ncbi:MAG TPA: hypothetical protein ENN80_12915, partial [Candidatus Hydrogenedentes bacterium]|nr:hypothetical protein [Candidatus Hydrogenedentota bacterium]
MRQDVLIVAMLFGALVVSKTVYAQAGIAFPEALERSAVTLATLDEAINDALILGNGDLNGLLFAEGDDLVLRVTKNDVWDARLDAALNPPLPTLERLKELGKGPWLDRQWILPEGFELEGPDSYHAHPYPCPRACCVLRIKGAARMPLAAKLDLRRAWADVYADGATTRVFAAADANVFVCTHAEAAEVAVEPI